MKTTNRLSSLLLLTNLLPFAGAEGKEVSYLEIPAIASAFLAKELCSCLFVTKRGEKVCYYFAKQTVNIGGKKRELADYRIKNTYDPRTGRGERSVTANFPYTRLYTRKAVFRGGGYGCTLE
jgi:hypothetical protein